LWRPQPAHGTPPRLPLLPLPPGGLPSLPALPASALPRPTPLAVAGPGSRPRSCSPPGIGSTPGHRAAVVAETVLRTQPGGSPVEGVEAPHRRQPPIPNHRRRGRSCGGLVPRSIASRSTAQSRGPFGGLLAQGFLVKTFGYLLRTPPRTEGPAGGEE